MDLGPNPASKSTWPNDVLSPLKLEHTGSVRRNDESHQLMETAHARPPPPSPWFGMEGGFQSWIHQALEQEKRPVLKPQTERLKKEFMEATNACRNWSKTLTTAHLAK